MKALMIKNYLLLKKQICFILIFCVCVTPVLLRSMKDAGKIGNYLVYFLFDIILLITIPGTISIAESRDRRAVSFLCMMPIRREWLAAEKYITDLLLVAGYALIYAIEAAVGIVGKLDICKCLMITVVSLVFRYVYIPLEVRFGYERTKFIMTFAGLLLPFGLPVLLKKLDPKYLKAIDDRRVQLLLVCVGLITGIISYFLSRSMIKRKDM